MLLLCFYCSAVPGEHLEFTADFIGRFCFSLNSPSILFIFFSPCNLAFHLSWDSRRFAEEGRSQGWSGELHRLCCCSVLLLRLGRREKGIHLPPARPPSLNSLLFYLPHFGGDTNIPISSLRNAGSFSKWSWEKWGQLNFYFH